MIESFLIEEEITKTIDKLEMEVNDEKINLDSILSYFNQINLNYKTNNYSKVEELSSILSNKFKIICFIHDDNVTVLKRNLNAYIDTKEKVTNLFDNMP